MTLAAAALRQVGVEPEENPKAVAPPKRRESKAGVLALRAWVDAYIDQTHIKTTALGAQIGKSRSTVEKWLNGTYDAEDQSAIEAAFQTLRDRVEGPGGLSSVIGFRETQTAYAIWGALKLAADGHLVILVGESGAGKSEAIKEAIRRAMPKRKTLPVYIEGTVFMTGYALVAALAKEIGVKVRGTPDSMMRDIRDKLRAAPRILILDEAHYAHERAIEALRQIRDMAGVGVVIIGTCMFAGIPMGGLDKADIMQELLTHRPHLEQVVSRATIIPIPGLDSDDAEKIVADVLGPCTTEGLDRLLSLSGESVRRFVRLVDDLKKDRLKRPQHGPITDIDVDAAWERIYPHPKKKRGRR